MMKKILNTILFISVLAVSAQAQWNWPEDKVSAEEKNVLYTDAIKMGNYRDAIVPLQWLITNAPDLNKSLYQNGVKIYDNLAKVEKDPARKQELLDSLMWMYDQRIKYFNDKANVLNRKAIKAYKYYIKDYERSEELLKMFDEAYELAGNKVLNQNLLAYMNVIKVNKLVKKNLTDEQVLERYDNIISIIDYKLKEARSAGKSTDRLSTQKSHIDNILTEIVVIDCAFVETTMGPKFKETPDDVKLVKRMFSFMLTGKCTDSSLFLDVAKQLQKLEPNYGLAKVIGTKCLSSKDYTCAEAYLQESLKYTEEGNEKSEVLVMLGNMKRLQGQKGPARSYYRQAISADPANKQAYEGIGDLYFTSFDLCKGEKDMVKDRLVFIAAYKMYQKAGNREKMGNAKAQFPSTEEIFNGDYSKGQAMTVGCWINEAVQLASRD
jgi:tetratricopeptide (TPR) repeat protein